MLHHKALLAISFPAAEQRGACQTIAELRQVVSSQQQNNASQKQTIAQLTAALTSGGDGGPASERARGK
jgi:hypothetical protein